MRYILMLLLIVLIPFFSRAQTDTTQKAGRLHLSGYAQIDLNKQFGDSVNHNALLDVHRLVLMAGYRFSERARFVSEIEFEHISEVYVEQAYASYKIHKYAELRAGLLLIPMGIVNIYHEPPTFFGVERPFSDDLVIPSTWREIGAGFSGFFPRAGLHYEVYLVNGFASYNAKPLLSGASAFRKARQKGANAIMGSPDLTARLEYSGIRGLQLGLSIYSGQTESTLFEGLNMNDASAVARADSSIVGLSMISADARYSRGPWKLRAQATVGYVSNTAAYNQFSAVSGKANNLASSLSGYYVEAGYDLLDLCPKAKENLYLFARWENVNLHRRVEGFVADPALNTDYLVGGLVWKPSSGLAFKADVVMARSKVATDPGFVFNAGVGVAF